MNAGTHHSHFINVSYLYNDYYSVHVSTSWSNGDVAGGPGEAVGKTAGADGASTERCGRSPQEPANNWEWHAQEVKEEILHIYYDSVKVDQGQGKKLKDEFIVRVEARYNTILSLSIRQYIHTNLVPGVVCTASLFCSICVF